MATQSRIIAAALVRAEKAADELQLLIRGLHDLEQTTDAAELTFNDDELSVTWYGGRLQFRKGAFAPYTMFRALYEADGKRLSHAEIAEIVFGDELAEIKHIGYKLERKLLQFNCPWRLANSREGYWLEEA